MKAVSLPMIDRKIILTQYFILSNTLFIEAFVKIEIITTDSNISQDIFDKLSEFVIDYRYRRVSLSL